MSAPPELLDDLYRAKLQQARAMTLEERLLAGPRLFDQVCRTMRDGIRWQFPAATAEEIERILRERLALARRLEDRR